MCRYLLSEQKNWRMSYRKERSTWWAASTALKQRQLINLLRVASWFSSPGLAMLFYARDWKQITHSAPTIWSHFRTSPGHVGHRLVSLVSCVTTRLSTLKTTCQISGVWCSCKFYGFEDLRFHWKNNCRFWCCHYPINASARAIKDKDNNPHCLQ